MSNISEDNFIVTREYRKFAEFCDACRRYRYIGLCYGPPGVGKTLSARHYADWERLETAQPFHLAPWTEIEVLGRKSTIFYTPSVLNTPGKIDSEIGKLRQSLRLLALEPLRREEDKVLERVRRYEAERKKEWEEHLLRHDWLRGRPEELPRTEPTFAEIANEFHRRQKQIPDPVQLLIVDEADRLKVMGLEQIRAIFDEGEIGVVLIGMPGIEKRLARYPQLYSRVGFVHEFRPLNAEEVRQLLQAWKPNEAALPEQSFVSDEVLAAIVRITGGNFRLLHRLLTQMARVLEINAMQAVTRQVVEAARESLVIGTT